MWNELVLVIKYDKVEEEDRQHARLLLSQLNTAGGIHLMRKEITHFLEDMVEKYGTIPTKLTLEKQLNDLIAEMEEFKAYWANRPKIREDIIMISNRMHQYSVELNRLEKQIGNYR
jgi:hypothetical protein